MRAEDYLKYAAAVVRQRIEWTTDEIGGSMCNADHELPLDALMDLRSELDEFVARFGNPNTYSDGRKVKTQAQIEDGAYAVQLWHPDVAEDEPHSWRGHLSFDPGEKCPGVYEVSTDPATQEIHVRVVRAV